MRTHVRVDVLRATDEKGKKQVELDVGALIARLLFLDCAGLSVLVPFSPEPRGEAFLIFADSTFHFFPSYKTILVFDTHNSMNDLVNFSLVLFGNSYPCLLENLLKMPKIAGHNKSAEPK